MSLVRDTIEQYRLLYLSEPSIVVTAPGRVNIIGEHTDYNSGYALPLAIDRSVIIAAGKRNDHQLHLHSTDLQSSVAVSLSTLTPDQQEPWSNYPKGVADVLQKHGHTLEGANFCIRGNIPIAAGLSSSAALEVASAIVFKQLNNLSLSTIELIQYARIAETNFVGVQCGIMDQFISVMGKRGYALFLDCQDLTFTHVPFPAGAQLLVCDTGVRRELSKTVYNRRKKECEEAVRQFAAQDNAIISLRDVTMEQLTASEKHLSPVSWKRALHVIDENNRVLQAVDAMKRNDLVALGKLMTASHASLRDNFEVSSKELNALVEIALHSPGVFGARMTGAGFGGSAICLVAEDKIDELIVQLRTEYLRQTGCSPTMYVASPDDGAAVIHPGVSLLPARVATC
jgi:galactokinase